MKRWRLYIIIAVGVAAFAATTVYLVFIAPGRRIAANEAAAISALRTISSAQELYKTMTSPGYGDYFELNNGKGSRYIKPELAAADPDHPDQEHIPALPFQNSPPPGYRIVPGNQPVIGLNPGAALPKR